MKLAHRHAGGPGALGALALASVAVLLAGCGGGSASNGGIAHLATNQGSSTTTGPGAGAANPSPTSPEAAMLAYANCMHANGEPNFPEPTAGKAVVPVGRAGSPAFKAAQAKCKKLLPPGPGSGPPPTAKTLAHYLKIAQCMRGHGVPDFPDPRTTAPSDPAAARAGGAGVIRDIEGVIFVFPGTIDEQSPAFTRAAAACAFPLHNH